MLDILGTIGGNVLSLPGILGFALGMMTRNVRLAAGMGALVGVFETIVFAGFDPGAIEMLEFSVAIVVGVVAATLGSVFRMTATTV